MNKKIGIWGYVVLFWLCCLVPSVGMLFYGGELSENRILLERPAFRTDEGKWNSNYFQELQTYVAEHFAFRGELVEADSMLKVQLFHSPGDSQVVIGKNGWLFYDETLMDYAGVCLSDMEIDGIARNLSEACDYIRGQGKEPLIVIVPNKNSIYSEYMPARFGSRAKVCNMTLLQERMRALDVPFVDAYHVLLNAKAEDELYLHEDTHWNNTGARMVLNEVYAAYGLSDRHEIAGYTVEESHSPDLYTILFPAREHYEEQRVYDDGKSYDYIGRMHSVDDMKISTSAADGNGKSILVYRDSFGRALIPYIGETFDYATFYRATPYDLSLVESTMCDYVLIEIAERNLRDLGQIVAPDAGRIAATS